MTLDVKAKVDDLFTRYSILHDCQQRTNPLPDLTTKIHDAKKMDKVGQRVKSQKILKSFDPPFSGQLFHQKVIQKTIK